MNNNADLSDVKTAITNGQQRAANVKYHNIVNGYQAALQVVDDVVFYIFPDFIIDDSCRIIHTVIIHCRIQIIFNKVILLIRK